MPYINVASCFIVLATLIAVLSDTLGGLVSRWSSMDESYSHGFLVIAIVLYLIFLKKDQIANAIASLNIFASVALFITVLFWAACAQLGINILQEMLIPLIIWLAFSALYGLSVGKLLIIPCLFMYFAIPFWDYMAYPLQLITVAVSELWLDIVEIDAIIDGVLVTLPNIGVFEVAHGCSGLRYLIVGTTLASLFSILNLISWNKRVIFVSIAIVFSLTANWIRVFLLILIGYYTDMSSSLIEDHEFFGWIIFAITLVPLFFIGIWLEATEREKNALSKDCDGVDISAKPIQNRLLLSSVMISLVCIAIPGSFLLAKDNLAVDSSYTLTPDIVNWKKLAINLDNRSLSNMSGYSHMLKHSYYNDAHDTLMFNLTVYSDQSPGKELVQDTNKPIDTGTWKIKSKTVVEIVDIPFVQVELISKRNGQSYVVLYSYYSAGYFSANKVRAKLSGLAGALNGRYDGSLILVGGRCDGACGQSTVTLVSFLKDNIQAIKLSIDSLVIPK